MHRGVRNDIISSRTSPGRDGLGRDIKQEVGFRLRVLHTLMLPLLNRS